MSTYIGLVYTGQPTLRELKRKSYENGASNLALHVAQSEITVIDIRIKAMNRRFPHRTWTLDQITEALSFYEGLMNTQYPTSIKFVLVYLGNRDILPKSLEITISESDELQKAGVTPPTPREKFEALFKR